MLHEIICHYNVKVMEEIPWCYHSNNTSLVELFHSAIYIKGLYKKWVNFSFANEKSERINIKRLPGVEFLNHPIFSTIDYVLYDCMGFLLEYNVWQMFLVVWFI